MSRSEDYLDQLLKGMSPNHEGENVSEVAEPEQNELEENIFSDILEEFAGDDAEEEPIADSEDDIFGDVDVKEDDIFGGDDFLDEDFLKEFELEMAKLENESANMQEADIEEADGEEDALSLFDDLDSILSGAKEQMEATEPLLVMPVEEEPAIEPEPMAEEPVVSENPSVGGFSLEDLFADDSTADTDDAAPPEDADVLKILEGLDGIDLELDEEDHAGAAPAGEQQDFSALEGFLAANATESSNAAADADIESFAFDEEMAEQPEEAKKDRKGKKAKKEKKTGEKTGFMNKLGLILFGEDDDDEEEDVKSKKKDMVAPGAAEQGEITIGEASADDLKLFGEYPGAASSKKEEKTAEKGKKEKKKKEKKEKVKKEKKPKPKKEKKPKPPKEPDNTPPLPKKPVFLIFLMVASLLALIVVGADLLGYSNQMTDAKNQYAKQNYSEAFAAISGMEIKKADEELYNKYHVMAMVSVELEAYDSLMQAEHYDMALDCLVRTVGRAEKYRADAETYGCIQELNALELEAEEILSQTFGVSKEEALEFYAYRSKQEYSIAIGNIIKELGLEKVTE